LVAIKDGSVQTAVARPSTTSEDSAVRADLDGLIECHHPRDARERAAKSRILAELDRLPRPFDRDADPVHVTASAVVVGSRGTVLHLHRRLGRWLQPGGHLDVGESAPEAAVRETVEETGLEVAHPRGRPYLLHLDVHPAADDHVHLDLRFLLVSRDLDPRPAPGESPEVRWFTWEEAEAIADDALVGALHAAREALGEEELRSDG
jgi:8-oxo-dGTP pyrophosphatase MutT (NUDIX family)